MRSRISVPAPGLVAGPPLAFPALFLAFFLAFFLVLGGAPQQAAADHHALNPCAAKSLNPCAGKNPCAAKGANPCAAKNACNPCAMKNPCAGKNPCGMKNPCGGKNPCAANPCAAKNACNPCAGKNPCASKNPCATKNPCNPCAGAGAVNPCRFRQPAGTRLGGGDDAALLAKGEQLWNDPSLSTNGATCATCHQGGAQFQASFASPYPHSVAMVKQMSGVESVNAAEMVQFCMLQPMQSDPLRWGSSELAALTTYVENVQKGYGANPCALKNPCSARNPCNPCSMKNPCSRH